jgi:hypothetical protein
MGGLVTVARAGPQAPLAARRAFLTAVRAGPGSAGVAAAITGMLAWAGELSSA